MPIDQIAVLEKRVHQIIELVKRLKQENASLEQKLRAAGHQLSKRERDTMRWNQDRSRLRSKVERILSEMESLPARLARAEGKRAAKSRKRGER
jgi:DNA anti-recombination protein RmuC